MKSTTVAAVFLAIASSASAQTNSPCPASNILEACLETTQGYLTQCTGQGDWQCLCDKWTSVIACFDLCPQDPRAASLANNKQLYCMNASLYATTTAKPAVAASTPTGGSSNNNAGQITGTSQPQASASASTTGPKTTAAPGAAANLMVSVGGILAAVAAVVAAVL